MTTVAPPGPPSSCRLYCVLARGSRKAVIFRRGPSKQTCLIGWDRATDTFEVGQWFKGRVYPERSDLSPDGEWLLVFMGNFTPPLYTWTVLSRPPWFTAVALWPEGDTWGGGGLFLGMQDIVLRRSGLTGPTIGQLPKHLQLLDASTPDHEARVANALADRPHAWRLLGDWRRGSLRRSEGEVTLTLTWKSALRSWGDTGVYDLAQRDRSVPLPNPDWADLDQNGDLLFARGGALYRLARADFAKPTAGFDALQRARLLADFTDLRFRTIEAPYSTPTGQGAAGGRPDDGVAPQAAGYAPSLDRITKEDRRARRRKRKEERRPMTTKEE